MSNRLIAHLAHVEVLTPKAEQSLAFFKDVFGLEESASEGSSVYLRGWGEWSFHSLQLTESPQAGVGHIGWRARNPEDLERAVANLEASGAGEGWTEETIGHGPAFRYRSPSGHQHEIFWQMRRYEAPAELRSSYPDRPQRYVPRGVCPRQIDHVTVMSDDTLRDARWHQQQLGSTFTEWTVLDDAEVSVFAMSTNNEKSHDLGLLMDTSGIPGRLHHVAYWVDSRDELHRAAEILLEQGLSMEAGPGRHGMGEQEYLYFKEPGGNRIEVNTGGYRLYVPDWEPTKWTPSQGSQTFYRNTAMPDSMLEGTPNVDGPVEHEVNPWDAASVR